MINRLVGNEISSAAPKVKFQANFEKFEHANIEHNRVHNSALFKHMVSLVLNWLLSTHWPDLEVKVKGQRSRAQAVQITSPAVVLKVDKRRANRGPTVSSTVQPKPSTCLKPRPQKQE